MSDFATPSRRDFLRVAGTVLNPLLPIGELLSSLVKDKEELFVQITGLDDEDVFMSAGWLGRQMTDIFGITKRYAKDIQGGSLAGYYGQQPALQGKITADSLDQLIKGLGKKGIRVENRMAEIAKELKKDMEAFKSIDPSSSHYNYYKEKIKSAKDAISSGVVSLNIDDFNKGISIKIFNKADVRAGSNILNQPIKVITGAVNNLRDALKTVLDVKHSDGISPWDFDKMSDLDKQVASQGDPHGYGKAKKDHGEWRKKTDEYEKGARDAEEKYKQERDSWKKESEEKRKQEREKEQKRREQLLLQQKQVAQKTAHQGGMHQDYDEPDLKSFKSFLASPDVKDIYIQQNIKKRGRPDYWEGRVEL